MLARFADEMLATDALDGLLDRLESTAGVDRLAARLSTEGIAARGTARPGALGAPANDATTAAARRLASR